MQTVRIMRASIFLAMGLFLWGCATTQDVRILDREINRLQSQVNTLQKEGQREKETRDRDLGREVAAMRNEWKSQLSAEINKIKSDLKTDLQFRIEKNESEIRVLSTSLDEYKQFTRDSSSRPSKEIDRVREDIAYRTKQLEDKGRSLEAQNLAQDGRAKALEEGIRALDKRLSALDEKTKTLDEKGKAMEGGLKAMEGKIDLVTSKQMETEKAMITLREKEKEKEREREREKDKEKEKEKEKEVTPEIKGPITGMSELYNDAYQAYQKGDMEGARRKFETFLKQYPNTSLSDNAQFWMGETYYAKKDYEKAVLEYEKVMVKYPEGDKVPAALFKQALAFLELGDKTNSKNLLRRVMERYPQSEQAELARKRLETIK